MMFGASPLGSTPVGADQLVASMPIVEPELADYARLQPTTSGGPGTTLSLAEYRALFSTALPREVSAKARKEKSRRREEEALMLADFA